MALIPAHPQARAHVEPTALHPLKATPQNVHWGYFDPAQAPALRVRSGDLIQAVRNASVDMLQLLTKHQGLSRNDAYSLMSVAGDLGITQVVDERQGAHIRMPRGIFPPKR